MKVEESSQPFYSTSALLDKARELGLTCVEDLQRLAVVRGLRYYDGRDEGEEWKQLEKYKLATENFSNAELAVSLLAPDLPEGDGSALQVRQRIASAVLSAPDVDPVELADLAVAENCESILRWIATCGAEVEPGNPFWGTLLHTLPVVDKPERAPHPTRFFAMSGIVNGKRQTVKQWIRLPAEQSNG